MEYPKIETLFDRDPATFAVIPGKLRLPEFGLINRWLVTEKIDGTNVRVHYQPAAEVPVQFLGRTDNAQMPTHLLARLQAMFPLEVLQAAFPEAEDVWLFGEGYGPKIQNGGNYRRDPNFRLFDVVVGKWWLEWAAVEDVAAKLGIAHVPVFARGVTLEDAIALVGGSSAVTWSERGPEYFFQHEGVVCRTEPLLLTRSGQRLMWKLKAKDFRAGKR